jgi:hypothetical protein
VWEAEHDLATVGGTAPVRFEQPLRFATYDDFVAWRRARASSD